MTGIDSSIPHEARVYDYLLGGKDNYEVDRLAANQILAAVPWMQTSAQRNRAFLKRTVEYVAGQGIDQFLDIGTGLPTVANTHEVAQAVNPDVSVVYTDYDPLVLTHARALLSGNRTSYIDSDLRNPEKLLTVARALLDFSRPVAVMLVAILHHLRDSDDPHKHVRAVLDAVPSGSYLVLSHGTYDFMDADTRTALHAVFADSTMVFRARDRSEVEAFVTGLELIDPGLVPVTMWRPEQTSITAPADANEVGHWGVVARKP